MKKCKCFKIYKFKYVISGDCLKNKTERWKRAQEMTDFKVKLINTFARENFKELGNKFINGTLYKGYRVSPFDTGMEMLQDEYGLQFGNYWDQLYIVLNEYN